MPREDETQHYETIKKPGSEGIVPSNHVLEDLLTFDQFLSDHGFKDGSTPKSRAAYQRYLQDVIGDNTGRGPRKDIPQTVMRPIMLGLHRSREAWIKARRDPSTMQEQNDTFIELRDWFSIMLICGISKREDITPELIGMKGTTVLVMQDAFLLAKKYIESQHPA